MPVLVTWKFGEDLKQNDGTPNNSNIVTMILPEFELFQDFMPSLVICKFNKDQMKTENRGMETYIISLWEKFSVFKGR